MARMPWYSAKTDPAERDRRGWLEAHGITPMNRSSRLWDMEIEPPGWLPHYRERVGSLDMARRQLTLLARGHKVEAIIWQGSQNMATGKAYDWCTCIEAARPDDDTVDAAIECVCTCGYCNPPKKSGRTAMHWRKRNLHVFVAAEQSRMYWDQYYHEHHWWIKLWRWIQHLMFLHQTRDQDAEQDDARSRYESPDLDDAPTEPLEPINLDKD